LVNFTYRGGLSGHTFTVLAGVSNGNNSLTVYDNISPYPIIGINNSNFSGANPAQVLIYRLDPNQQYLIRGAGSDESIQGSVYNNLIQPGNGKDTITAGAGNNQIQDTRANLDRDTVTDYHLGDTFDFTDIAPNNVSVTYQGDILTVTDKGNNNKTATITLTGAPQGEFATRADANTGTLVGFSDSKQQTQTQLLQILGPLLSGTEPVQILNFLQQNANLYQKFLDTAAVQQDETPPVDPFANVAIFSGSDIAPITTATQISAVIATAENATVNLTGPRDVVLATADGNDSINVADTGNDLILVGAGNNTVWTGQGQDTVQLGGGDNLVRIGVNGLAKNTEVIGGEGNYTIIAETSAVSGPSPTSPTASQVYLNDGNNLLEGGQGNDSLLSNGSGNDTLVGGTGDNTLIGAGSGAYSLVGGNGNNLLGALGGGNETLQGGQGNATLYGNGSGNYLMSGGNGDNFLEAGGSGNETLVGGGNGNSTLIGMGGGTYSLVGGNGDYVFGAMGGGNETLQSFARNAGDDSLYGNGSGNYLMTGGNGNDFLEAGGSGNETLAGGGHADWNGRRHLFAGRRQWQQRPRCLR
jgi:Ca2+-binding RTX toxin-like protein